MPRKGIFYFATKRDMESALEKIETQVSLKYTKLGLFDTPNIKEYLSYKELPDFGLSVQGDASSQPIYLLYPKSTEINAKEVPQRRGGVKYSVNDMNTDLNHCFRFVPAGEYQGSFLIPGEFSPGVGEFSDSLYKIFRKEFLKGYKKIKSYSVGPEAYLEFEKGTPLTPSYKANPNMHLKF